MVRDPRGGNGSQLHSSDSCPDLCHLDLCFAKILFALRMARFPAATAGPSRLSLHPRAPRIYPGGTPTRYTCVYKGWRNADVFATLGCFGLGSPIVPVVQSSQSHMRKDVT